MSAVLTALTIAAALTEALNVAERLAKLAARHAAGESITQDDLDAAKQRRTDAVARWDSAGRTKPSE